MIWIIIIAVILLIVLAVNIPVTAYIRYHDGEADVKVSFLFKQLYPHVEKKKRQKRKRKKHRRPAYKRAFNSAKRLGYGGRFKNERPKKSVYRSFERGNGFSESR